MNSVANFPKKKLSAVEKYCFFKKMQWFILSGDIDLDDISRHGDDSDEVMSTTTMESEITYGSHWDLNSSGRPASLFSVCICNRNVYLVQASFHT